MCGPVAQWQSNGSGFERKHARASQTPDTADELNLGMAERAGSLKVIGLTALRFIAGLRGPADDAVEVMSLEGGTFER